ncbi:MAG: 1-deoxy-D-xylulose-5-phosphate reductoisomerase [Betaproteobacteria bacterium]|nr:MAG: 1-deoxy-D-xylulose-5-phosphate reductoisomerase [Betaproteobacteria bacterium]
MEIAVLKHVVILGATGSIGDSTLKVLRQHRDKFSVLALAANANWQAMLPLIAEFEPEVVAMSDADAAVQLRAAMSRHHPLVRVEVGPDAVVGCAAMARADVVVAGISGFAGLPSTWAAVEAGKTVLLANKEALVAAGDLLLKLAQETGARVLPIDSEHNAVYQCANGMNCEPDRVRAITLTASGGPFRTRALDSFETITPEEACKHPTWDMGRKISVDSATLMNKGLEVIEAALLFRRSADDVHVLIHPTSSVHAVVEMVDGSMLSHIGPSDMQVPIAHALAVAHGELARLPLSVERFSLARVGRLEFFEVDPIRYPALPLAYAALRAGQRECLVLNAANEVAVAAFLNQAISFTKIVPIVERALEDARGPAPSSLFDVFELDRETRERTARWLDQSALDLNGTMAA